jgi:WG containing repeat
MKQMKFSFTLFFLFSITLSGFSQEQPQIKQSPPRTNYRYGLVDTTGQEKVPLNYDRIDDFRNGLALAVNEGKYYFLDRNNKIAFSTNTNPASSFYNKITYVKTNNKFGFIDKNGKSITPYKYDEVDVINLGKEELVMVRVGDKYGFVDNSAKEVIPVVYENTSYYNKNAITVKKNGKFGCINSQGIELIQPKYDEIGSPSSSNGLIAVKLGDSWGYVDFTDKVKIPINLKYDFVGEFGNGYANVGKNSKQGLIDISGKEICPLKYDNIGSMSQEGIAFFSLNGNRGFINNKGVEIIPAKYEDASFMKNGLAKVKHKELWGFVDSKGQEAIAPQYPAAGDFTDFYGNLTDIALINSNYKYGFINPQGQIVIPTKYDRVGHFEENKLQVSIGGKWGFIDKKGKEITPCMYDEVKDFKNGFAGVKLNKKWGFINKNGVVVVPIIYERVGSFSEGLATVIQYK